MRNFTYSDSTLGLGQFRKDEPRQTRWSREKREAGLCWCGAKTYGNSLCRPHLNEQRERMRKLRRAA